MIKLESPGFENGEQIPKKYTGEGIDMSPPLSWSGEPDETKEFALICEDPDAPQDEPWVHWVVYRIPGNRHSFPEGGMDGAFIGNNSWGKMGYNGPMPPRGHGTHHYHFKIYALDRNIDLSSGAGKEQLLNQIEGKVMDEGELVGVYSR
jgi:Raf kinase inhibitor-like YbhB/YbcL family protein